MIVCSNPQIEIYNEDCFIGMNRIPDKSIDMVLCDLPYGETDCEWDNKVSLHLLWKHYRRIIKDNGVIALFGTKTFFAELILSNKEWFRYDLVWEKERPTNIFFIENQFGIVHEHIAIFYNKQPTYNIIKYKKFFKNNYQNSILKLNQIDILKYLILTFTNEQDTVLDNCCGFGNTLVACKLTNRKGIGFEIEKKFYDIAIQRIKECNTKLF